MWEKEHLKVRKGKKTNRGLESGEWGVGEITFLTIIIKREGEIMGAEVGLGFQQPHHVIQ